MVEDYKKFSLGFAMIVKDAQDTVARAILSAKEFCSQIVVVDTGSHDSTPSAAARAGAQVHFDLWTDDFGAARNHALGLMHTDWVLMIDSDEELDTESMRKNILLLANEKLGGINVVIRNALDHNNDTSVDHRYTRLFRNHPGIRYTGKIHEQVRNSIEELGMSVVESDILINHYGYSDHDPEKIIRNKKMLDSEITDHPDDPWLKYHMGETEFSAGNYRGAAKIFKLLYTPQNQWGNGQLSMAQCERIAIRMAQIALKDENIDDIKVYTNFTSNDANVEGLRLFILGTAYMLQHDFANAADYFESPGTRSSALVDGNDLDNAIAICRKFLGQ